MKSKFTLGKAIGISLLLIVIAGVVGALGYTTNGFSDWTFKNVDIPWGEKTEVTENAEEIALKEYIGDWSLSIGKGENLLAFSPKTKVFYVNSLDDKANFCEKQDLSDNEGNSINVIYDIAGTLYNIEAKFVYNNELLAGVNLGTTSCGFKFQTYELGGTLRSNYVSMPGDVDYFSINPYSAFSPDDRSKIESNMHLINSSMLGFWDISITGCASDYYDIKVDSYDDILKYINSPQMISLNYMIPVIRK